MTKTPICPYCNLEAQLVKGNKIYPHRPDLHMLNFWYCDNGHDPAYMGCHKVSATHLHTGEEPLGRLANAELMKLKSEAHAVFDPLWKNGKFRSRGKAYNWLANVLNIPNSDAHIGMFDEGTCRKVIKICKEI